MSVNEQNASNKLDECTNLLDAQDFARFTPLFREIVAFLETNMELEALAASCNDLRDRAKSLILQKIEIASVFEEFQEYLQFLADIVDDKRELWTILHSEMSANIRVTLHQSQLIAAAFFTPVMLFEYGFETFEQSNLCDFTNITNEEALVDIFYAVAGFVRACNLPPNYESRLQRYIDFINKLLSMFTKLPDFDAYRFVWLVEAVHNHLHLANSVLKQICEHVLQDYTLRESTQPPRVRLHKMCVISTSRFLQQLKLVRESINSIFREVIEEQRLFVRKYIFSCFACIDWSAPYENSISEPLNCWRLMLVNITATLREKHELPISLLIDFIDDSLVLFEGYYGSVQATRAKSSDLRQDIFTIVELVTQFYPAEMENTTLKRLWFLLLIAAVSGARDEMLVGVTGIDSEDPTSPFLGLERDATDFIDYKLALQVLTKKFENESEAFEGMVTFVRAKYNQTDG